MTSPSARSSSTERPSSSVRWRSSLSSRAFSMAMTAWPAKLRQLDLLVGERTDFLPIDRDCADRLVLLEHRHAQNRANAKLLDNVDGERVPIPVGLRRRIVVDVDHLFRVDRAKQAGSRAGLRRGHLDRRRKVPRGDAKAAVLAQPQSSILRRANLYGVQQHGLEHGLQLARRAGNDPQHLRRRRLLLQRFGQLARALLLGLEQPHVLDGDHGLVGEGLDEGDLLVRERLDLEAIDHDHAQQVVAFAGSAPREPCGSRSTSCGADRYIPGRLSTSGMWIVRRSSAARGRARCAGRA